MVEGVVITDRTQRIRLANDSLQRMLDLTQSPVNRTVIEVFLNTELQQAVEKTLFDGIARRIELTLRVPAARGLYDQAHRSLRERSESQTESPVP